ncbi:substrate-binding domain-containing protein [Bacillus sp. T3]|uniref:substrate-binding domain-containing protein n=1 Tax=Bacillus sp. T3 TaxID=467262 RepID=UPI002981CD73|nr:substrate-binding domain-containing protein [Bacillus sp. T3]
MHGETGKVRIGAIEPMALYRMPKILAQYSIQYPKVQITIEVNNTQNLTRLLKDGEIDFALCNTPELDHTLSFEPLLTENVSLLLPETHPLQQKESIYLSDFQNERLLLGAFVCNYRIHLEKSLMEAGVHPQIGLVVNSMTAIKEYVQAGLGIAVIPDVIIGTPSIGLVKRKIEDLKVGVVTGILKKANGIKNGAAVERLITALKESTN